MLSTLDASAGLSLAERDRRWAAIRAAMREEGVDILIATGNTGRYNHNTADARYITNLGGNDIDLHAIVPLEGDVTAIARADRDWVTDIREHHRSEADGIIERLQELGANGKRIGVAGLEGLIRSADGIVVHGVMKKLQASFPAARLVNATSMMLRVRAAKSDEEIARIQRAVQIAEAAVGALVDNARPGVKDCAVYARMFAAEIENGGEIPVMLAWHAGKAGEQYRRLTQASATRVIESGDIIYTQIEGKWQGYLAQLDQTVTIGKVPDLMREMADAQIEAFNAAVAAMKPGATFAEVYEACANSAKGRRYAAKLILHGRGLGEDWPLLTTNRDPVLLATPLQENYVVDVKPGIELDGKDMWGRFGDSVRVTRTGAERLGTRPQGFINLG